MKEIGVVDNTLNKAVQAKGKRNVSYLSLYGCPESSKCYFSQCTCHLKKSLVSMNEIACLLIIKQYNKIIFRFSHEL